MRDKYPFNRAVYYTSSDDLHNSIYEYEFADDNGIDPHTHQKLIPIPPSKPICTNHTYIHLWDENKQYINSIRNNGEKL